ncbi:hypothetical protein EQW76_00645 [Rhizobium sp. rho-13.1]|uniref:hypothetical protein n=1 Tax=Rhizobium sp. rho-13.1 TaxID=2506431 RepID=UPI00115EE318|nr:hypothetical protein [Rhizobium sp. rho-13.1]TQX91281.1 hypothetical protein EQW76_00645 [Rhizobium sp. rho-13.1]
MTNLRVGMKVVCIEGGTQCPVGCVVLNDFVKADKGKVYTVRAVGVGAISQMAIIRLVEIPDQWVDVLLHGEIMRGDVVFDAAAFRPVVERKTDISIFKAMLTPSKARIDA